MIYYDGNFAKRACNKTKNKFIPIIFHPIAQWEL